MPKLPAPTQRNPRKPVTGDMLVSVMHFVDDDADPAGIIAALTGVLAPGSRLVISHATADFH
ncbi:SAM-dependent methyltransferase, partial [Streptomyces alkaliphilus]|uniref:SAM-dependent methyltransferase n=1 Tax=Streptomyces alkaliphilus TaxID=1472722 RepID=UPI00118F4048